MKTFFTLLGLAALSLSQAQCEAGSRLFDHELLATDPVCLPTAPKRVVVADFASFDTAYALGIEPVGYWGSILSVWYENAVPELMPSLQAFLADARDVGEGFELSLEAVLETQPDLILLPDYHASRPALYEQFSAIAPTVVMTGINTADWREHMRFYAAALGREADVEARLAAHQARLDEFITSAGNRYEGVTATQVQAVDTSAVYLSFPNYRGWGPLRDAGYVSSAAQVEVMDRAEAGQVDLLLSNERLDLLDTEYLFFISSGTPEQSVTLAREIEASPLWASLPVVQNGRLYFVDLAWQANGLLSAEAVTDDLFRLLLHREPPTPNPFQPE